MPEDNNILFTQQTLDLGALFRALADTLRENRIDVDAILSFLQTLWVVAVVLLFLLAALFMVGYIYAAIRANQYSDLEAERLQKLEDLWRELYGRRSGTPSRFSDIEAHINSDNPNDWKLAIIEADIILGQVLDKAGYIGATIGEQLKSASGRNFSTLDDAWQAHRVRNQIAHEGADFVLTKKLARDTITQYRRVFAEFGER
jgi:hypothetical protein